MIKYLYNHEINSLEIDPQFIEEGLVYAENNNHSSLRIRCLNQNSEKKYDLDFVAFYNKLFIQKLKINDDFKIGKITNLESLQTLNNIRLLSFNDSKLKIDFSNLSKLEELYFKYNTGIQNLSVLKELKHILISSLKQQDLRILSGLEKLEVLRLSGGSFVSTSGVEALNNIKKISIDHQSKILDISNINKLPNLSILHIEKCKQLNNYSFLKGNTSIKELFIDNLDSLEFIATMPNLEKINFWLCKDGDMTPLLESKSLKQINFYPNKRHYSHTIEEVINLTRAQRGRNK